MALRPPSSVQLRAGDPDDDNREYLPESLKESRVVVNENGNNSQPYPARLREHRAVLSDGVAHEWYSFVPENYDPSAPSPLVVSLHGGLMTGWGQAVYSSWTMIAEREGFIVVFPNATSRRMWTLDVAAEHIEAATTPNPAMVYLDPPADTIEDFADMKSIMALIQWACGEYAVDTRRVYIQGMSMGNSMGDQFARRYGALLAGVAGSGGPSALGLLYDADGLPLNRSGPVPTWLTLCEYDTAPPFAGGTDRAVFRGNRDYWLAVNGCDRLPRLRIDGHDNFAFYEGGAAPFVFRDVKNRDHGQTFDEAELVWSHLFSGQRRAEDGAVITDAPRAPREGDLAAVAVADARSRAWVAGRPVALGGTAIRRTAWKYHGVVGDPLPRGEHILVPVTFLAQAFGGSVSVAADGSTAEYLLSGGRRLTFAAGSIGCVVDDTLRAMTIETVLTEGTLHVPIEWIATHLLGLHASTCAGVLFMTDHHALLSTHMAHLIDDLLADEVAG
ncbi:stalk domain-containing protein [Microbacterium sp. LWH3-1.2]|uniref:stalk domain-containing protein n=1 Tax=Microbacterium sp. LWH3-1.2 TaxID=3135256 RepID=UPI0034244FA1